MIKSHSGASSDVLIRAENVGKIFCRDLKKSLLYGLKDCACELLPFASRKKDSHRSLRKDEFWANQGISFQLRRGECLGLIGHNGAGKTTLLRMLNGLIKPDEGSIEIKGRVGAIIALGAGFNPILTGRENIYVNASIIGLSKSEIDSKIDEIIDFAEIREFIDSPVQSYSSGMQVRLGFAVATVMEPDVLILDEVLAVGDLAFRTKCLLKISSMLSKAAVIFVSHSQEQVQRICTQGILLKKGVSIFSGPVKDCFKAYHETLPPSEIFKISHHDDTILSAELTCSKERHRSGEDLSMRLSYKMDASFRLRIHVMMVRDESGTTVATVDLMPCLHLLNQGDTSLEFSIRALSLKPGTYTFLIETIAEEHARTLLRKEFALSLKVFGSLTYWSSYTPKAEIKELSTKEQLNKFLYAI